MDKLYIVMPAYNEAETIGNTINDWYPVIEKYSANGESRLLVIDDGSKDNTYHILCEMTKHFPLLRAITKKNEGHGATLLYGYHYAIQQGADYIFQTDSDGQTNPEEFHVFWNKRHSYDMVIGYRNKRQDGLARILVTKILRLVISICFGVWVKDANTPFRLMKVSTLKEEMQLIPEKFNLTNVLIAVIYEKKKKKILYLPITFRPRQGGTNSIHMKKICSIGLDAIKDFAVINKSLREVIQKNEY